MITNRRNLVLKVSIVINVAVLLYAAMHLSNTNGAGEEWVPVTMDGSDREMRSAVFKDKRNFSIETSGLAKNSEEFTSQKVVTTASTSKVTTTSTASTPDQLNVTVREAVQEPEDENVLTNSTLGKLRSMLQCSERPSLPQIRQRGEFWVLFNYVLADQPRVMCHETITYTTHAGFEFLDNVHPLVERWMAPISLAIHAPGSDIVSAVNSIRYLRDCLPDNLVRNYVTFHVFFSTKHVPSKIPKPDVFLSKRFDCALRPPYLAMNLSSTFMKDKNLLYPVNVARNVAREAALTHFILPSDIELYPSPNMVPKFLNMIARNNTPLNNSTRPRVFPISIFEIDDKMEVPRTKNKLLEMLKSKKAFPFHKFVCPNCHSIPQGAQWMIAAETDQMDVFHVGKRQGKFLHWEPIFIGTHQDPYYDERLSWEGKSDKMTQGYVLCVKDYDFMILKNAFLIHKPGIKRYKRDPKREKIAVRQTKYIKQFIMKELKSLYGERKGCTL